MNAIPRMLVSLWPTVRSSLSLAHGRSRMNEFIASACRMFFDKVLSVMTRCSQRVVTSGGREFAPSAALYLMLICGESKPSHRVSHVLPSCIFWEAIGVKMCLKSLNLLATPAGFEPATFSLEGCCSIP